MISGRGAWDYQFTHSDDGLKYCALYLWSAFHRAAPMIS